jgi:predicted nucleic acid-binding Zn ribbon protein
MVSLLDKAIDCHRCGHGLERGDVTCSNCGFRPKEKGLRIAMSFLFLVVLSMTATMIVPSPLFVLLAAISFLLTICMFVLSFVARPYRFGSLFVRF